MTGAAETPRWKAALKAAGWSVAFLLLGLLVTTVCYLLARMVLPRAWFSGAPNSSLAETVVVTGLCELVGFLAATWLIGFRLTRLSATDLRWKAAGSPAIGLLSGLGWGAGTAAAAAGLAAALGVVWWSRDAGGIADYLSQVGMTALVLAPSALSEELMFRGVPLILLAGIVGRAPAVALTSAVFAAFHLGNPNVTTLGLTNILIAGVFLGLVFYRAGGLWTAFGAHLGWNVSVAAQDAEVSGVPFKFPWIDYHTSGPEWVSGGAFGPEGGIVATLAVGVACLILGVSLQRKGA